MGVAQRGLRNCSTGVYFYWTCPFLVFISNTFTRQGETMDGKRELGSVEVEDELTLSFLPTDVTEVITRGQSPSEVHRAIHDAFGDMGDGSHEEPMLLTYEEAVILGMTAPHCARKF